MIARSPTEGARRPYVRRPHSPPVAARSLVLCAFPRDAFVRCWHVRGSPAFSFVVRRPRGACGWIHGVRVGNFRFIPLGNTYTGNCLIFLVEVGMQFWSCDALVYVVVCRCVRFGICSGAAPAGFGFDHPVSGGRRLAGHYPFCVSLSVRAVMCTRRVACLFSSALRACALPFGGTWAFGRVFAPPPRVRRLFRVFALVLRGVSFLLLRGVAPVRAASLHFPSALSCRRSIGARPSWDTCLGLRLVW